MSDVRIHLRNNSGPGSSVQVDGAEIASAVQRLVIEATAHRPAYVTLEVTAWPELDFTGQAVVRLTESTHDALVAMGWTPPSSPRPPAVASLVRDEQRDSAAGTTDSEGAAGKAAPSVEGYA